MLTAIMIDSNEIASAPWINNLTFGNTPRLIAKLDHGDAWGTTDNGDLICIERKSPSDFLNSVKDNHIFKQAAGIRERTPYAYLVITGTLTYTLSGHVIADDRITGWRWNSIQGALLEIQDMGVKIIYCMGNDEYEPTVMRLFNRERCKEKILEPTVHPRIMSPGEIMLTSLPGIGIERAQLLLREFNGNPAQALAWLTRKKTTSIAGVGDGIKKAVKSSLCLGEYEEIFVLNSAHYPIVADYLYDAEKCEKEILT